MNAVDTNVLIYVHDYRDSTKQTTAKALVSSLTDNRSRLLYKFCMDED
jgi:hypothetical protein